MVNQEMNLSFRFACIMILVFLATNVAPGASPADFLDLNDAAIDESAKQDMRDSMNGEGMLGTNVSSTTVSPSVSGKNMPAATVNTQSSMPKSRLLNPLNKWRLDLQDSLDRIIELEMHLTNDVVFGKGTMMIENVPQDVMATGTISGKKLNLDILSSDLTLYRLVLTMNGKSLSGDYHAYSTSYTPWKGIAMGSIQI
jgi:hypothetical protein